MPLGPPPNRTSWPSSPNHMMGLAVSMAMAASSLLWRSGSAGDGLNIVLTLLENLTPLRAIEPPQVSHVATSGHKNCTSLDMNLEPQKRVRRMISKYVSGSCSWAWVMVTPCSHRYCIVLTLFCLTWLAVPPAPKNDARHWGSSSSRF